MRGTLKALLSCVLAGLCVGVASAPPPAVADGDPASDVLFGANVFYPYSSTASASTSRTLTALTAAAKNAGFPIKVALIAGREDLGAVGDLFGKPQAYATFLDQEISFNVRQPLLVAMPGGLGGAGLDPAAAAALAKLAPPAGPSAEQLAQAAVAAVPALARAAGHPFKTTGLGAGSGGASSKGSGGGAVVFAVPLLLVALAVAVATMRAGKRA